MNSSYLRHHRCTDSCHIHSRSGGHDPPEVGISQFVFLVLFCYSFFFKGYTGLAITVLSIATLLVTMQITARLGWDAVFRKESGLQRRNDLADQQSAS